MSDTSINGANESLDLRFDENNMFREEVYTDLKVGTVRSLTPVNADGSEDHSRTAMFVGTFHIMTPAGTLPVEDRLPANNLKEAIAVYPETMAVAAQKLFAELEKLEKEKDSRIIVPNQGPQGPGSGLM